MVKFSNGLFMIMLTCCLSGVAIAQQDKVLTKNTAQKTTVPKTIIPKVVASDIITIETTIAATQEQPKLLSIVPWRSLNKMTLDSGNLQHKLNQRFTQIEPSELKAQLLLQRQLKTNNSQK
jgi:hypothetical protein